MNTNAAPTMIGTVTVFHDILVMTKLWREMPMDNTEFTTTWEGQSDNESKQIANMDEYDFMILLMESRIIQAS